MPELPEVQTIVDDLKKVLPGLKIRDVWCDAVKNIIKNPRGFKKFKKEVIGRKFLDIERKGKNILIHLSGGKTLLIHQKMTGHMLYGNFQFSIFNFQKWTAVEKGPLRDDPQNRFIHLVFSLSNGKYLALSDVRKFAKVLIWEIDKLGELKDIKSLGPNPMDRFFTFEKFKKLLEKRRGKVRDVLMKQEIISGIGNIYVSEILWEAGIYPFRKLEKLTEKELKKLYNAIRKVFKAALKAKGDSIVDYRRPSGEKGEYQKLHKAYQREGEKCLKKDGGIIKRIKKGGRSAFFCPKHQK